MSSELNKNGEGTETVGQKIDKLSAPVVERFDAVDVALVEQRQYTEFAFDRLESRLDTVESRFDAVDRRFDAVDSRFDTVDSRFDRLERKLDQFIDTQSTTNKLVERRLTALEPRSAQE